MCRKITIGWMITVCLVWMSVLVPLGSVLASDTMLMFVGEDLEVLSIASRREEAAWSAPAVADVITRHDLETMGAMTISQALETMPGFYMNPTEKGSVPYLRGIQNSALFLFDTVPMGSGGSKSDNMIDYETSLAPVKRIEIVRGTGSVLWGPDAFAGVVNAVPLTGRDFQGVETGVMTSSENAPGEAYVNWGKTGATWSSFFSASGRYDKTDDTAYNVVRFWGNGDGPEPVASRYGADTPDASHFVNLYGNITYRNWLTLSAGVTDNRNAYTVTDWDATYAWEEQAENRTGQVKIEAAKTITPYSGIRFTGYYREKSLDQTIVDYTLNSRESSWYGELIWDQSFFASSGLFTLGASLRQDDIEDLPVWDSFFPDYFSELNGYFLPDVEQLSYDNLLTSVFAQYRQELGDLAFWAGIRYDDHEEYDDNASYNLGASWRLGKFILKSMVGTAYRTPFGRQLTETSDTSLERIENINAQLSWKGEGHRASLTLFNNRISDHVIEDRYAGVGLSTANSQTINGAEIAFSSNLTRSLTLSLNLTLLDNNGPKETYYYHDYSYTDEDGGEVKHYQELEYAYDTGPKRLGNLRAQWRLNENLTLVPELRYFSERTLYYPVADETKSCSEAWITDVNLLVNDYFPFDLRIFVTNVFDQDYASPGIYSITWAPSLAAGMAIRYQW